MLPDPLLSHDDCARIHAAALEVLAEVGVRVDDASIAAMLAQAGARLSDGPQGSQVAHIPPSLVEWALAQAPKTLPIADRAGHDWQLGTRGPSLVLTGNALYYTRDGERRELRSGDLADLARLVDACPNIHGMVGTAMSDVPPQERDFAGLHLMARHTAKHLRPCIFTPKGARLVLEMAQVLADGAPLRERPVVSTGFSILSPLHWTSLALSVFRETAGAGMPATINSEPLGGVTAPVTLSGCLVIGDADVLSGLVINQLLEPGRPCLYNIGFAHVLDMRSAIALTGAPENALLQAGGALLARYHGLPCAAWMSTEAMQADEQATMEKMMTGLAHASSGVGMIWGAGNLESTLAMSPEMLVMDDEIAGYFLRYREGIDMSEESLALPLIKEIGLSGEYLGSEHTLAHYRQLSRATLAVRERRAVWEGANGRSFAQAAEQRVAEILAAEPRGYLDAAQEREMERIERSVTQ
jgi:trimethylamine---corrinoid protein Co-methyltransferase